MLVTVEVIKSFIEEADPMIEIETLKNDLPLNEQGIDSLDSASIYLLIEEKYGFKIPDDDISQLDSINNIVTYVNKKAR